MVVFPYFSLGVTCAVFLLYPAELSLVSGAWAAAVVPVVGFGVSLAVIVAPRMVYDECYYVYNDESFITRFSA